MGIGLAGESQPSKQVKGYHFADTLSNGGCEPCGRGSRMGVLARYSHKIATAGCKLGCIFLSGCPKSA